MKEVAVWLEGVERRAAELYRLASEVFSDDEQFSTFLADLAEEEAWHRELLATAVAYFAEHEVVEERVVIDIDILSQVQARLDEAMHRLEEGTLSASEMAELLVEVEFCEWNDIFLFVLETLKEQNREFQKVAASIEEHRCDIENFFASWPEGRDLLARIRELPSVAERRFLVVEDSPAVSGLLKAVLSRDGEVIICADGREGLAEVENRYFDVVISDVAMPEMDGIELYRRSIAFDPDLKDRFIFFTASQRLEDENFFAANRITCLRKPASINHIRQAIAELPARRRAMH